MRQPANLRIAAVHAFPHAFTHRDVLEVNGGCYRSRLGNECRVVCKRPVRHQVNVEREMIVAVNAHLIPESGRGIAAAQREQHAREQTHHPERHVDRRILRRIFEQRKRAR